MEVAKLAAPPNLEVRFVSCNKSAIKRWLSSELEETVFSLTHELFMTKHHTVTLTLLYYLYPATLFYTGKSISVINKKTFWLEMSVCKFFGCNEDISVNILNICQYYTLC